MLDVWIMASSPSRREWLSKSISHEPHLRIVGTAATFAFLRSLMTESLADIAVIELSSDTQSTNTREWLAELLDLLPVVLLVDEMDAGLLTTIRRSGAGGLLQATASSEQIVQAIKSVGAGLTIFDGTLVPSAVEEFTVETLTPRESEVLRLLADGLSNKDIAVRLRVSEHTIKFHIRSILGKLGAASRTEAVTRGLRSGLIEL
jgi:two-component system, NarL family, response regulator YdfI